MIKTVYRKDLEPDFTKRKKNILSFRLQTTKEYAPILEINFKWIWCILKHLIRGEKVYILTMENLERTEVHWDIFTLDPIEKNKKYDSSIINTI